MCLLYVSRALRGMDRPPNAGHVAGLPCMEKFYLWLKTDIRALRIAVGQLRSRNRLDRTSERAAQGHAGMRAWSSVYDP